MAMLPPDRVLTGGLRWLALLQRNTAAQAWAILTNDARYSDLTQTQYHSALAWLREVGLVTVDSGETHLAQNLSGMPLDEVSLFVAARAIALQSPPWLPDAEVYAHDPSDLPLDASRIGEALGLDGVRTAEAIRRAKRKYDADALKQLGTAGEACLIALLEERWPGSTSYIAADDDTAGYDIAFAHTGNTWHLEAKSTRRRGRLAVFVSRHEYETYLTDPTWRLVVVGLDIENAAVALATVKPGVLSGRAPVDSTESASWASAEYSLTRDDLIPRLWIGAGEDPLHGFRTDPTFAWAPA